MMNSSRRVKLSLKSGVSLVIITAILFFSTIPVIAQESLAPLNPDFVSYLQDLRDLRVQMHTPEGYALGYIPPPQDLSHLAGLSLFQSEPLLASPPSYDLRALGKLTPVKDQGNCGSCWSFATYGSLESNLLPSETWDFSENNLKNRTGYDFGPCDGGNAEMSTAYFARWSGPVRESDDPYGPSDNTSPSGLPVRKHIQEVLFIPGRASASDNENIKQAVMNYGALYTHFYWNNLYYNATTKSYYYNGDPICRDSGNNLVPCAINHAVVIVGWDDNYDRNKFSVNPPGNGAFIIKNSWGTSWGEDGFFYMSYYDSNIGKDNHMFNNAEEVTNYGRVYEYDPLGWTTSVGFGSNNPTGWFANVFKAAANELLAAVSFYVASPNSPYEIHVYTNAVSGPISGSLAGSKTGTIPFPGYHTIPLDSLISLNSGENFSVVVKLTTPGYGWPVPVEWPFSGYSSQATAGPGESYISGNGIQWSDITTITLRPEYQESNVCLKAFTKGSLYSSIILFQPNGGEVIPSDSPFDISWGSPPQAVTFNLYSSMDNGIIWKMIAKGIPSAGDTTTYPWQVPKTGGNKNKCLIKVTGYDATGVKVVGTDRSDAPFSIEVVKVLSPNGGELYHPGDPGTIEWRASSEAETFDLMFSLNNGATWGYVENGSGVTGRTFTATILPPDTGNKTKSLVRVIAYNGAHLKVGDDRSDGPFTIEVVKLTYPDVPGLVLKSKTSYTITSNMYDTIEPVTKVQLFYTMDGGATWKAITSNPWTVPVVPGLKTKCKIKVVLKDARGVTVGSDMSDNFFTIEPAPL